uniref:Uncharacterized protein n=1 Tax=Leptocylindrus danicus TaxID=163516 RepID=A0A7S2LRZ9_9STRA|eukprot:CAMPEP_0116042176 /NCGR_PEP_ID=MMETSP0321-20121206/25526_1 /TAXON_ID=163516 /ORGANISM="Leptocylindrus danicus var. danicus, Strain B650" /LENGTH=109 /DNA_ID=CAMNT_0003522587 /DNA_START=645 /DNA_END=974 /DNA_ORIENTATION=+
MRHQQEGLPEGVNTAQSILSTDMKKAETAYEVKRQSKAYSSMYSTHSTNDRPSHILSTAPMELSERNTTGFVEPVAEETPDDNSSFSSIEDGDASVADEKEGIALYNES